MSKPQIRKSGRFGIEVFCATGKHLVAYARYSEWAGSRAEALAGSPLNCERCYRGVDADGIDVGHVCGDGKSDCGLCYDVRPMYDSLIGFYGGVNEDR